MHLQFEKKRHRSYILFLFLIILFPLVQCTKPSQTRQKFSASLTETEKAELDYFLRFLIFENYGAFVLFGSKPLCEMPLFDSIVIEKEQEKRIAAMSQEERAEWEKLTKGRKGFEFEKNPYQGWLAWKKVNKHLKKNNYLLVAHPESRALGNYCLVFADVKKTAQILSENYPFFKEVVGFDFQPQKIVYELENPNSLFWKRVFALENHVTKGLLFGYGKENAQAFEQEMKDCSTHTEPTVEKIVPFGEGGPHNFTIPLFGVVNKEDEMVQKYEKEKRVIEEIYKDQDIVEVTLEKIAS